MAGLAPMQKIGLEGAGGETEAIGELEVDLAAARRQADTLAGERGGLGGVVVGDGEGESRRSRAQPQWL